MTTTTAKFKSALRESVSKEFAHVPSDENNIEFTFSRQFERQMDKLINSQRKIYYNFVNTALKRVAVILVICLTILTTAFSVKAIREPIVNFIKQIYSTFTHYSFEGDISDTITKEYLISSLPDEYIETNKFVSETAITTVYENSNGDKIKFRQQTTSNSEFTFDSENKEKLVREINGIKIDFYLEEQITNAIWINDEYSFYLTAYGNFSIEEIDSIIKSIQ